MGPARESDMTSFHNYWQSLGHDITTSRRSSKSVSQPILFEIPDVRYVFDEPRHRPAWQRSLFYMGKLGASVKRTVSMTAVRGRMGPARICGFLLTAACQSQLTSGV